MKKTAALLASFFLLLAALTAEPVVSGAGFGDGGSDTDDSGAVRVPGIELSFSSGIGLSFGVSTERLYLGLPDKSLYNISWLTWERLPVVSYLFEFTAGKTFSNGYSLYLTPCFANLFCQDKTGVMQDYDAYKNDGRITDYSRHDCLTLKDTSAGFSLKFYPGTNLGLGVGFEYEHLFFQAKGGYGQRNTYGNYSFGYWNPSQTKRPYYDDITVITYDVMSFYWKAGFLYRFQPVRSLSLNFDVWLYPYRYNLAEDLHYKVDAENKPFKYWMDEIETLFSGFQGTFSCEFFLNKKLSFLLELGGTYLPAAIGPDYYKTAEDPEYSRYTGFLEQNNENSPKFIASGSYESWSVSGQISVAFHL